MTWSTWLTRSSVCTAAAAVTFVVLRLLRSGFPRKLAHAGPELWIVVDLG